MFKDLTPILQPSVIRSAIVSSDFSKAIFRVSGNKSIKVNPIRTKDYPTPAKRPYYSVLNKAKIKKTYGIEIPHWEDSLAECIKEFEKLDK